MNNHASLAVLVEVHLPVILSIWKLSLINRRSKALSLDERYKILGIVKKIKTRRKKIVKGLAMSIKSKILYYLILHEA